MSHIHTAPGQHDFTASAFIVRLDTPEPTLLLHMHKKLHKYFQFGGHVELHENPWQAITHELAEESGYGIRQLKLLQPKLRVKSVADTVMHPYPLYVQTHNFPGLDHYHTDIAFAFCTTEEPAAKVGNGESAEIAGFTLKELRALPPEKIVDNVRESGIFVLEKCLHNWESVSTDSY